MVIAFAQAFEGFATIGINVRTTVPIADIVGATVRAVVLAKSWRNNEGVISCRLGYRHCFEIPLSQLRTRLRTRLGRVLDASTRVPTEARDPRRTPHCRAKFDSTAAFAPLGLCPCPGAKSTVHRPPCQCDRAAIRPPYRDIETRLPAALGTLPCVKRASSRMPTRGASANG